MLSTDDARETLMVFKSEFFKKRCHISASSYHNHNKAHVDLETDFLLPPVSDLYFCSLILSSIRRKPLGHPPGRAPVPWSSPSLRAS